MDLRSYRASQIKSLQQAIALEKAQIQQARSSTKMLSTKEVDDIVAASTHRANSQYTHAPPAYDEATSSQQQQQTPPRSQPSNRALSFILTPPNIPYSLYTPPGCSISSDWSTITIVIPNDSTAAQAIIDEQLSLPPRIELRIKGTHKRGPFLETDFSFKLDMLRYFVNSPDHRSDYGSYNPQVRCFLMKTPDGPQQASAGLVDESMTMMAHAGMDLFKNAKGLKSLTINRKVHNWNIARITERVRALASELNYKGTLSVEAECTSNRSVRFVNGADSKQKASAPWFTPIVGLFEKSSDWEVDVSWPYANREADDSKPSDKNQPERECVVCDEDEWWRTWKLVIRNGMLQKKNGWMGAEDWIDAAMKPADVESKSVWSLFGSSKKNTPKMPSPWGMDTH